MKLRFSPRAIGDLIEIADYLTERSPRGARSVERSIQKAIDVICLFPGSGRTLEQRPSVRVMPIARYPYLMFYTLSDDEVRILHIRHASRAPVDPAAL